jgi:dTDP-4-dehydrorhamnose reductase
VKVLITGADGQLGEELQATCPEDVTLIACGRSRMDITREDEIRGVLGETRPDLVLNAAAYTAVDRAETDRELAFAVNGEGPHSLARGALEVGARLIHFSTDFVFSGDQGRPYQPDSGTDPQSVYGASKLAGESLVLEVCENKGLVVRTSWVYSRFGGNFVATMLRLMSEREQVSVVMDQIGTPTWTRSLAGFVWASLGHPEIHGLYHWTDAGVASWYDFAIAIQEEARALELLAAPCRVLPVTTAEFPTAAHRPPYSVLDTSAACNDLGLTSVHWRRQLRTMLLEMREHGDN